ncbi:hypothetical protein [Corynebacterium sp. A21]|uniref:hypothetical protein n=1 Tax=Corynebacterium sp. A21 TaxID=3457318 RepID=UPI003FD5E3A6
MIDLPAGRYGPGRARQVPDGSVVRLELRLPAPLAQKIAQRAEAADLPRTRLVERILVEHFRRDRDGLDGYGARDGPDI